MWSEALSYLRSPVIEFSDVFLDMYLTDSSRCPSERDIRTQEKAFFISRDLLLSSKQRDETSCTTHSNTQSWCTEFSIAIECEASSPLVVLFLISSFLLPFFSQLTSPFDPPPPRPPPTISPLVTPFSSHFISHPWRHNSGSALLSASSSSA